MYAPAGSSAGTLNNFIIYQQQHPQPHHHPHHLAQLHHHQQLQHQHLHQQHLAHQHHQLHLIHPSFHHLYFRHSLHQHQHQHHHPHQQWTVPFHHVYHHHQQHHHHHHHQFVLNHSVQQHFNRTTNIVHSPSNAQSNPSIAPATYTVENNPNNSSVQSPPGQFSSHTSDPNPDSPVTSSGSPTVTHPDPVKPPLISPQVNSPVQPKTPPTPQIQPPSVTVTIMEPNQSPQQDSDGGNDGGAPSSQPPQSTGGKRVYVGNLSWDTRWQGLKDHMREAGEVAHAEVFTESSGRSAGCGIVEFESPSGAENAINTLNDSMLDGRTIFVRADREEGKPNSTSRFGGGGGGGGSRFNNDDGFRSFSNRRGGGGDGNSRGRKIVIWNLPYHIRWQDLKDLCRDYGNVIRADVPSRPDGKSKGMGTVLFESEAEADRAIQEMTGKEIDGRIVDCRLDKYA